MRATESVEPASLVARLNRRNSQSSELLHSLQSHWLVDRRFGGRNEVRFATGLPSSNGLKGHRPWLTCGDCSRDLLVSPN